MRRGLRVAALLLGTAGTVLASDTAPTAARGRALFLGEAPLNGRIVHQDFVLPARASRCINCHGASTGPAGTASAPAAPVLDAATLAQPMRRRGGPPSQYDAAALCRLLRTGVDPAFIVIQRTMPRYEISDDDCRALWLHLSELR